MKRIAIILCTMTALASYAADKSLDIPTRPSEPNISAKTDVTAPDSKMESITLILPQNDWCKEIVVNYVKDGEGIITDGKIGCDKSDLQVTGTHYKDLGLKLALKDEDGKTHNMLLPEKSMRDQLTQKAGMKPGSNIDNMLKPAQASATGTPNQGSGAGS